MAHGALILCQTLHYYIFIRTFSSLLGSLRWLELLLMINLRLHIQKKILQTYKQQSKHYYKNKCDYRVDLFLLFLIVFKHASVDVWHKSSSIPLTVTDNYFLKWMQPGSDTRQLTAWYLIISIHNMLSSSNKICLNTI